MERLGAPCHPTTLPESDVNMSIHVSANDHAETTIGGEPLEALLVVSNESMPQSETAPKFGFSPTMPPASWRRPFRFRFGWRLRIAWSTCFSTAASR
jgi:hypothetical protein